MQKILIIILLVISPTLLFAKIKHTIHIPEFDDNDTFETFSIDGSVTNFFNNPDSLNARPDFSGTAYNRYEMDIEFERKNLFIEGDIACLTDKDAQNSLTTLSEIDKDFTIGYRNEAIDLYVEYEHNAPTNHTITRSYTGVGGRYNYSTAVLGSQLNWLLDIEKVILNNQYGSRPDGTGKANMIYGFHLDYDLPGKFSFSTEHIVYTDDHKYYQGSEWDRLFQINYQISADFILFIYEEVDTFLDMQQPLQIFYGAGVVYEF
ncbi:MAG: hypothetical protein NTZ60_00815 [Campylobacterales bacterium]|nr:hypothetical protein [Campylobacterales bacterium]